MLWGGLGVLRVAADLDGTEVVNWSYFLYQNTFRTNLNCLVAGTYFLPNSDS